MGPQSSEQVTMSCGIRVSKIPKWVGGDCQL